MCWIILQTAINDWLMGILDKVYDNMIDYIWESGWNRRGEVLWDDMIPVAMALGAVFSLIVVGKMAYKAMTLEEEIDFMKLWKPLAMVFVISNWYIITYGIFSFTQPIEDYFRQGFLSQNAKIVQLQRKRMAAVTKFDEITRSKEAEAMAGEVIEKVAMTRHDIIDDETGLEMSEEQMNDILISSFGESYYDMKTPLDSEGEELEKFDATTETRIISAQNKLERFMLWCAEALWACAVIVIFLVRAFFMTVLVMFGPIYMAAAVLPAWEDAWKDWIEKYIAVCFLGAAAFLGLIFASHIIIWGVQTDVLNWEEFASSDAAWYEWFAHVMQVFCASVGVYLTALLTGAGILGVTFELATYFYPSQMPQGVAALFEGIWNSAVAKTQQAGHYATVTTKKASQKVAGNAQAHIIEKNETKAKETLNMGASMGPEGQMKNGRTTGEFKNKANTYQDYQDSSTQPQKQGTYAAHRWADRLWQQKLAGTDHASLIKTKDRMAAARQDLEEYFKAQKEGRGEQFLKEHTERMRENRILLAIVTTGRVDLHFFGGDAKKRDAFLKKHGLYKAFKRADKLERKADRMDEGDLRRNVRKQKVYEAREATAERIFGHISIMATEILAARGIVLNFSELEQIKDDELKSNAFVSTLDTEKKTSGVETDKSQSGSRNTRAWERLFDESGSNDEWWVEADKTGTYRMKKSDEGYENVQQQMKESWFRKLTANKYNRMLLMYTLQAYERALEEGRGEQFVRDMENFGAWQREGFNEDEAIHPFSNVHMERDEYVGMWEHLRDTEKLRRINEALDAMERANEKNEEDNA